MVDGDGPILLRAGERAKRLQNIAAQTRVGERTRHSRIEPRAVTNLAEPEQPLAKPIIDDGRMAEMFEPFDEGEPPPARRLQLLVDALGIEPAPSADPVRHRPVHLVPAMQPMIDDRLVDIDD